MNDVEDELARLELDMLRTKWLTTEQKPGVRPLLQSQSVPGPIQLRVEARPPYSAQGYPPPSFPPPSMMSTSPFLSMAMASPLQHPGVPPAFSPFMTGAAPPRMGLTSMYVPQRAPGFGSMTTVRSAPYGFPPTQRSPDMPNPLAPQLLPGYYQLPVQLRLRLQQAEKRRREILKMQKTRQRILQTREQEQRAKPRGRGDARRSEDEDELEEQRERLDMLIDRLESVLEGLSSSHEPLQDGDNNPRRRFSPPEPSRRSSYNNQRTPRQQADYLEPPEQLPESMMRAPPPRKGVAFQAPEPQASPRQQPPISPRPQQPPQPQPPPPPQLLPQLQTTTSAAINSLPQPPESQTEPAQAPKPAPPPRPAIDQKLTDELASLLNDSDDEDETTRDQDAKDGTAPAARAKALANKTLKRNFYGLWGANQFDYVAKPRWRYEAAGEIVPPEPERILKGKALLRGIAMGVRFVLGEHKVQLKKKALTRDQEAQEFAVAFPLYIEQSKAWISKVTKTTIASIAQDEKLRMDLHPTTGFLGAATARLKGIKPGDLQASNLIKLKVRMKGIVTGLCSEQPSPTILQILSGLCGDGIYFPNGFLFESEKRLLDFNALGATRHMVRQLHDDQPPPDATAIVRTLEVLGGPPGRADVSRVAMMLVNFLLVRLLIGQVILKAQSGTQPNEAIVENLRLVASVMYMLLRRLRPELLELESKRDQMINSRIGLTGIMSSLGQGRGNLQDRGGSRPDSNLSATTANALADASLTPEPGRDGSMYMTNAEIVSQLLPKEYFGFVIYEIDEWLKPCEAMLREWLDKVIDEVVRKVLATIKK